MHIVLAIDSFKGSLSSIEAGNIAAGAILKLWPDFSNSLHNIVS